MTDNQDNFTSNKTAEINIEEMYANIIQEIDKYRSFVSVSNNIGLVNQLIKALSSGSPDKFISQIKPETSPQESRCHTFYRLIGLPVISPDDSGALYSPGYDLDNSFKSDVLNKHYQVIQSINSSKPDLFKLMDARETTANGYLKIFSLSDLNRKIADINSSVLLLSSVTAGKVRKFGASLENSTDPFDSDVKNQSYTICTGEPTNSTDKVFLTDYKDANGNVASGLFSRDSAGNLTNNDTTGVLKDSPLVKRAHFLKPFMVDPRVDLTVNPPKGIICAPFVLDSSKTKYNDGTTLTRPFIELVCRKRFNKDNQQLSDSEISKRYQDLVDYVRSTDQSIDQSLLDKIAKGVKQTVEATVFTTNINIIAVMIDKLHNSIQKIQETESLYHWLPIPDPKGPEINIGSQDIKLMALTDDTTGVTSAQLDSLSTPLEGEIVKLTAFIDLADVNSQTTSADLGGFALQGVSPIPDGSTTQGLGTRNQNRLEKLTEDRLESTNNAANALRTIEIIMGEFSGLGLCDIIAIYTALWTVDKNVLVNMLDDEAFDRMYSDPALRDDVVESRKSSGSRTLGGTDVLQQFESKIKEIYNLMDKLLQDRFGS